MTSRRYDIALIPGDGIGPEVTQEAVRVIEAVALLQGIKFDCHSYDLGAASYLSTGELLPRSVMEELRSQDAIFLGAVGDPSVESGVLERGLLLRLRQELDLYVNVRPAKRFSGVTSPTSAEIDILILRENTEGLYSGQGKVVWEGTPREVATEVSVNTAQSVERLMRYAFEAARDRKSDLALIHKTNVLQNAGSLYSRIFAEVAEGFPEVSTDYYHVDAAALLMTVDPGRFEVMVTDNAFGDILSDLAAGLAGGIGFVGSANLHPGKTSMFEPVHGSAPDIAGSGKANPIGAILSASLMLAHLGEQVGSEMIESAVARTAGTISAKGLGTKEAADAVLEALT